MNKWKAWLCVIGIFLAGAVVGGIIGHRVTVQLAQKALNEPAFMRRAIVKRLTYKLDLSDDQRKQVEAIVADSQTSIRQLRSEVEPRFDGILKNAEGRIDKILNPEQQAEFKKLLSERRRLWRRQQD